MAGNLSICFFGPARVLFFCEFGVRGSFPDSEELSRVFSIGESPLPCLGLARAPSIGVPTGVFSSSESDVRLSSRFLRVPSTRLSFGLVDSGDLSPPPFCVNSVTFQTGDRNLWSLTTG